MVADPGGLGEKQSVVCVMEFFNSLFRSAFSFAGGIAKGGI